MFIISSSTISNNSSSSSSISNISILVLQTYFLFKTFSSKLISCTHKKNFDSVHYYYDDYMGVFVFYRSLHQSLFYVQYLKTIYVSTILVLVVVAIFSFLFILQALIRKFISCASKDYR